SALAISRPMPRLAPVTSATRPVRSIFIRNALFHHKGHKDHKEEAALCPLCLCGASGRGAFDGDDFGLVVDLPDKARQHLAGAELEVLRGADRADRILPEHRAADLGG